MLVGESNRKMIESSDGMLAVLDGTDVDGAAVLRQDAPSPPERRFRAAGGFRLTGDSA